MIAVPVTTRSAVTLGQPAILFEGRCDVDPFNGDATNYDVFLGATAIDGTIACDQASSFVNSSKWLSSWATSSPWIIAHA
jgi:hypothetical protein